MYTTGPVAEIRFKKTPTEGLKLKIQRVIKIIIKILNLPNIERITYMYIAPIKLIQLYLRLLAVPLIWEQKANVDELWTKLLVTVRHSPR